MYSSLKDELSERSLQKFFRWRRRIIVILSRPQSIITGIVFLIAASCSAFVTHKAIKTLLIPSHRNVNYFGFGLSPFLGSSLSPSVSTHIQNGKCRNAFIDLGTNTGKLIRDFVLQRPSEGEGMREFFKEKNWNPKEFCVFGFEGNAAFNPILQETEEHFRGLGFDVTMFTETVVGEADGMTSMFLDTNPNQSFFGSSIMESKKMVGQDDEKKEVIVKSIALGTFIKTHIDPRGVLLVKMDIEGGEYPVLQELISSGALCSHDPNTKSPLIDFINVEFHCRKIDLQSEDPDIPTTLDKPCVVDDMYKYIFKICGVQYDPRTD